MTSIQVQLPDKTRSRLEAFVGSQNLDTDHVIDEAICKYISWYEEQVRLWKLTKEGLDDIEAGRVVPGEEVMSWMETWIQEHPVTD